MTCTILVVDDETRIITAITRALRNEPCTTLGASTAEDALQILASQPVAVVVSDESMPGMKGTDLLSHIRQHYPDTVRILMTGHGDLDTAISAVNRGEIYRFFTKPCNMGEFIIAIRQALSYQKRQAQARRLLDLLDKSTAAVSSWSPGHE